MILRPPGQIFYRLSGRILFFLLSFTLIYTPGYAQTDGAYRIVVDGFAYGKGLSARDGAVADGKNRALTMWLDANLGTYTSEDAAYFLGHIDTFILSHRILSQHHEDQGVRLEMEAYLDAPKLRLETARYFMPRLKVMPKVVFLVGERHPQGNYTTAYGSTAIGELKAVFEESGFAVVRESVLKEFFTEIELADRIAAGAEAVAKVGRTVQADIVVMGEVRVGEQLDAQRGNLSTYRSDAKLFVVRAYDGRLIDSVASSSEITSARPADGIRVVVEDAVYKVNQSLLVAAFLGSLNRPDVRVVHLTLEGEGVQRSLPEVLVLLRSISTVERIETLRTRPHTLLIRFGYNGKMSDLVEQIGEASLDGITLEAQKIIGGEMHFRAVRH
ncbi:MAG: hypothetical protein COA73_07790 [Candidatus Hydrogenedentota bacterium]|nr:MAG: hypothetical protein COA73_07790 [Candidatus Hydrogenedentota bacterium]